MFENPRRGRQARNFTTNVPKILDLKSSSDQIFSKNGRWVPLKKNDFPLNEFRKLNHSKISSLHCFVRRMWWYCLRTPLVRSIILRRKARPGRTTEHAKFNNPISDCSSLRVTPQGAHTICLCSRLLFYSKCTRFTVCLTYSEISLTTYRNQW